MLPALAIVFAVQCIIGASAFVSYQLVDGNAAGMVELARGCVEQQQCAAQGGEGRLGLFSGASWIRLTAHSLRAGGDLAFVQGVVRLALILSAGVTFFMLRRYLGLRAAVLALGLYLPLALAGSDIRSFDNPNLFPLPAALYYAGILLFIDSRKTIFGVFAALALAAATSVYLIFLVLVPFHVAVVALFARRPVPAVVASCLSLALVFCLDSIDAARAIVARVSTLPATLVLTAGVLSVILGFAVRALRRSAVLAAMATPVRLRLVMTAALLYATLVIWLACGIFGIPTPPEARYFGPAIIPLLYLAAESTSSMGSPAFIVFAAIEVLALLLLPLAPESSVTGRTPLVIIVALAALGCTLSQVLRRGAERPVRFPAVAVLLLCFGLGVSLPDIVRAWPGRALGFALNEGEPIVSSLYAAGYTYSQIAASLQGPAADHLLPLLAAHDPQLFEKPVQLATQDFSLLLLKVPPTAIPQTRGVLTTLDTGGPRAAIVVRGERPFIDWLHAQVCPPREGEKPAAAGCLQLLLKQALWRQWPYIQVGDPATTPLGKRPYRDEHDGQPTGQPSSAWSAEPNGSSQNGGNAGPLRVIMPARTPGLGVPHIVRPGGLAPDEAWEIVAVTGIDFEGDLPATQIRLPDRHEATGTVEFEVAGVEHEHPWNWLRHLIEVTEENTHLLQP